MDLDRNDDFVNVAIRIRPPLPGDELNECVKVITSDPGVLYITERNQTYSFDNIFSDNSDQQQVYDDMVRPLVDQVIEGYNSTVFAYGQTGTGKTYTIGSDPESYEDKDSGLITRALNDILNRNDENKDIEIAVSFYEIYNEKVYDLLSNNKNALQLKGFKICGLIRQRVADSYQALELLYNGGKNRHTGGTKQNSCSSRSHAIFTIYCNVGHINHQTEAKLNLVDLAGSESIKRTGNEGIQLHEGISINKGLLCIGQVINALSSNRPHVPYRQSTITMILQDSLNKNNYVTLIACVGPNIEDVHETIQTLDFAQRAKRLKSKPALNNIAMEYTRNNPLLTSTRLYRQTPKSMFTYEKPTRKPPRSLSATLLRKPEKQMHSKMLSIDNTEGNSLFHPNVSSISTAPEFTHALSPIVKKCIDAVENSILEKLENIIRGSIETPVQAKNTPKFSWSHLQTEVKTIVQSEFKCLTRLQGENAPFRTNTRDSDISIRADCEGDETQIKTPAGYLDFYNSSPIASESVSKSPIFKIPKALPRKKLARKSKLKTSSPILTSSPKKDTRCSMTLRNVSLKSPERRRSVRIASRQTMAMKTPKPIKTPRAAPRRKQVKSDLNDNNKRVLNLLNNGTEAELTKLNSIGPKSARMLHSYIQMRGALKCISDLRDMPWRGKCYQRFLEMNFLIDN